MELQKTIKKFHGYNVSIDGIIYKKNGEPFKMQNKLGYLAVNLRIKNKTRQYTIHRLVIYLFGKNKKNFNNYSMQVNHKDGNKKNNHLDNLEWVTASQNTKHAYDMGLCENVKKRTSEVNSKKVYDTKSGLYYNSIKEASECKHINYGTLRNMLNGHDRNKTSLIYA